MGCGHTLWRLCCAKHTPLTCLIELTVIFHEKLEIEFQQMPFMHPLNDTVFHFCCVSVINSHTAPYGTCFIPPGIRTCWSSYFQCTVPFWSLTMCLKVAQFHLKAIGLLPLVGFDRHGIVPTFGTFPLFAVRSTSSFGNRCTLSFLGGSACSYLATFLISWCFILGAPSQSFILSWKIVAGIPGLGPPWKASILIESLPLSAS